MWISLPLKSPAYSSGLCLASGFTVAESVSVQKLSGLNGMKRDMNRAEHFWDCNMSVQLHWLDANTN